VDTPTGKDWLARWQKNIVSDAVRSRYCDKEMGEELGWLVSPFLNGFYYGHLATGDIQWVERLHGLAGRGIAAAQAVMERPRDKNF